MSLPTLRGTARLLTDPRTGDTKTGGRWTSALVKFPQWRKTDDGWQEGDGAVASIIGFDERADVLAAFAKGDEIDLYGTCVPDVYQGKPQLKVTLDGIRRHVKEPRPADAGRGGDDVRTRSREPVPA